MSAIHGAIAQGLATEHVAPRLPEWEGQTCTQHGHEGETASQNDAALWERGEGRKIECQDQVQGRVVSAEGRVGRLPYM